ncbi:hypothetical protein N7461_002328 [Penicillium sp. DV-2018c]|nr:hypothetical protein N7461_002328 [Penicillium sp. DV-2018c]
MPLCSEPYLEKPPGSSYYRYYPARDDSNLNAYNALISLAWKANIDIAPCTGRRALMEYIAKYSPKAEEGTQSFRQMLQAVLLHVNRNRPLQSTVNKLLNRLIAERDWSAQEIFHMLLGPPLQQESREVIKVDCRPDGLRGARFVFTDANEVEVEGEEEGEGEGEDRISGGVKAGVRLTVYGEELG